MKTFIEVLLRMSAYGSIAVLLVIVLRALFRKLPKKATVLFWLVAAVRLVCPVNFETPLSLFNLAPQSVIDNLESSQETAASEAATTSANDLDTVLKALSDAGILSQTGVGSNTGNSPYDIPENGTVSAHEITSADPLQSDHDAVSSLIFIIWGVGVAGILAYVAISAKRANLTISRLFRHKGEFLESDEIRTPFVFGIFSPKICVPSSIDVNEKDYMLLHEQIHIKNHDALIKAIALAVLCLHWFNPLVWVAFRLLLNDLEMRCDEEVVDILGDRIRKEYCLSIVNHAKEDDSFRVFTTAFAKKSLGRMEIKMRIKNLINYKKVSKLTTLIVLITALSASFVLTSCATTDAPEANVESATTEAGAVSAVQTTDNNAGTEVHTIRVNSDGTTFKDSVLVTLPDGTKTNMVKVSKDDISDVHSVKIEGVPEDTETVSITSDNSTLEFAEDDYTVSYEVNDDWKGGVTITSKGGSVEEGMVSIASEVDSDDYSESTYVYEISDDDVTAVGGDGKEVKYVYVMAEGEDPHRFELNLDDIDETAMDGKKVVTVSLMPGDDENYTVDFHDGSGLCIDTKKDANFDSLEEFRNFYSLENARKVIAGEYDDNDPRVAVMAWSHFGSEDACKNDTYEEKNGSYIMHRAFEDGTNHFNVVYSVKDHTITRLENVPADAEG